MSFCLSRYIYHRYLEHGVLKGAFGPLERSANVPMKADDIPVHWQVMTVDDLETREAKYRSSLHDKRDQRGGKYIISQIDFTICRLAE